MKNIEKHQRVNEILLAPLERPALQWLAAHMPPWVTPDILTTTGFVGTMVTMVSYILTNLHPAFLWLASLGFIINWFGDSLDGTIARYRHIERPRFGFYIDHTLDAFSETLIVIGIGLSPFVRFDLACLALVGYLLLANIVFINTCVIGEFRISYGKLGPTEVRAILILANAIVYFTGNPSIETPYITFKLFEWMVIVISLLLYFFAIQSAWVNGRALKRLGE